MASIHYTLIGDTNASDEVTRLCGGVATGSGTNDNINAANNCHLLRSVQNGDEGLTLESLYDYCGNHPRAQVTYLHNKGSFHPSAENSAMRRMCTKAVFSDSCQAMPVDECTICSARFAPLPHTHMTGNMWTADCSYVNKLIHPLKFGDRMSEMVRHSLALNDEDIFPLPSTTYYERPHEYGIDRYSFEYWVGSHPKMKPCDVFSDSNYLYGFAYLPEIDATETSVAPPSRSVRRSSTFTRSNPWIPTLQRVPWMPVEKFWNWSFNEWFCGRGRLAQYKFLYDMYPDADSFVWSYYGKPFKKPFKNFYSLLDRGCPVPVQKTDYI